MPKPVADDSNFESQRCKWCWASYEQSSKSESGNWCARRQLYCLHCPRKGTVVQGTLRHHRGALISHCSFLKELFVNTASFVLGRSKKNWWPSPTSEILCCTDGKSVGNTYSSVRFDITFALCRAFYLRIGICTDIVFNVLVLEVYQFARDAAVAEGWLIAQEPYLLSQELGVSCGQFHFVIVATILFWNLVLILVLLLPNSTLSMKLKTWLRNTRPLKSLQPPKRNVLPH